jgi:alkylation response protein AidB-like acyl-CoA dehydrogenase
MRSISLAWRASNQQEIVMDQITPRPVSVNAATIRQLIDHIAEGAAEREFRRILPYDEIALIKQARLGALRLPVSAGGGGASFRALYETVLRLAAADANVAHILRNHFVFVERFVQNPVTPRQHAWQKAVADGALFGLANGELDAKTVGGTPLKVTLQPDGDGFRITGNKFYSTGTLFSEYVLTRVSTQDGRSASAIIPTDRDGVTLVDDWDGVGQRLTGSGSTLFDNVRVEANEVVVDAPDTGYGIAYGSTLAQLYLTTVNAGILRNLLEDAKALVTGRKRNFYFAPDPVPSADPILQQTIGEVSAYAHAAVVLVLAAADALDASDGSRDAAHYASNLAAKAKVVVDSLVLQAGSQLFDVGGASAALRERNLDRHWRNARTLASHNPRSYKARALGQWELHGTPLPAGGFF